MTKDSLISINENKIILLEIYKSNYSASNTSKRLPIMNDLMSKMNVSNNFTVSRVMDNKYSIVMSERDIKGVCDCYSGPKLVI